MPRLMLTEQPVFYRNDIELTRERLTYVLNYFSQLLARHFMNLPVRLVVHGGACMLLHPSLYKLSLQQHQLLPTMPRRTTTRDVNYIKRSFAAEWSQAGFRDATERLQECIMATARHFRLGADWMNSDADIALPMATDPTGKKCDPIYAASVQPNNINLNTIYNSPNGLLTLISVTPFWAVSLKLVRYAKWDPGDICLLLRNGTILSGAKWTTKMLEDWLYNYCSSMGYANYDARRKKDLRMRILHAIQLVSNWTAMSNRSGSRSRQSSRSRLSRSQPPNNRTNLRQENMIIPPDAVNPQSQWNRNLRPMIPNIYAPSDYDSNFEETWSPWEVYDLRSRRTSRGKTASGIDWAWNNGLHHVHSVGQFDYSLGSMSQNWRGSIIGSTPGAPEHMEDPVIPIMPDQKRDQRNSKSRDRKWRIVRDPTDTEFASDEENDQMRRGRSSVPHTKSYNPPLAWWTSL